MNRLILFSYILSVSVFVMISNKHIFCTKCMKMKKGCTEIVLRLYIRRMKPFFEQHSTAEYWYCWKKIKFIFCFDFFLLFVCLIFCQIKKLSLNPQQCSKNWDIYAYDFFGTEKFFKKKSPGILLLFAEDDANFLVLFGVDLLM